MNSLQNIRLAIAAGGTGGHIFPALSVALQFKKDHPNVSLLWIGTSRNREKELCERHGIPLVLVEVTGIERKPSLKACGAVLRFFTGTFRMRSLFKNDGPNAVIAFGGYVCAPALAAAWLASIPFFIHEQNTVLGLVNRLFFKSARKVFLGFPLSKERNKGGPAVVTGTPVRSPEGIGHFSYPETFDKKKKTILICGGSQGAQSMNICLVKTVKALLSSGVQIVWQTGAAGHHEVINALTAMHGAFVFPLIDDLYPYYAVAKAVVCRSGASTLAEIAYFGLPCVMVPLPWAAENHQWTNAGVVQSQGWGIRVKQDEQCGGRVELEVRRILDDEKVFETMSKKALDNSPVNAARVITETIVSEMGR